MDDGKWNIVVAHPDKQHSFGTATALEKAGCLSKYITTVYYKKYSWIALICFLLNDKYKIKLKAHRCEMLDDSQVKQYCEFTAFFHLVLLRLNKKTAEKLNEHVLRKFNKKVKNYVCRTKPDAVILYDSLSGEMVQYIKQQSPNTRVIIDMSAAYYPYMCDIFKSDILKNSDDSAQLEAEMNSYSHYNRMRRSELEIKYADAFLVASNFTKKSLVAYGADEKFIYNCPYGIMQKNDIYHQKSEDGKMNCLYVGNINQNKGVKYLLEAIKKLNSSNIQFTFVGAYHHLGNSVKEENSDFLFTGHLVKEQVLDYCSKSDLLIFPSLSDGFGLSVLEAMSCGTPVICSRNAGIADAVVDGYNGFLIDAQNSEQIAERILWFTNNRNKCSEMGRNALETSKLYTWDHYNKCLLEAISDILK